MHLLGHGEQPHGLIITSREKANGHGVAWFCAEGHVEHHVRVARKQAELLAVARIPDIHQSLHRARVHDGLRWVPHELGHTRRVLAHMSALDQREISKSRKGKLMDSNTGSSTWYVARSQIRNEPPRQPVAAQFIVAQKPPLRTDIR
jgi:hypothetical protein